MELLPDDEIRAALAELPEDFRMAVYYADVMDLPYRRSPRSWTPRWGP